MLNPLDHKLTLLAEDDESMYSTLLESAMQLMGSDLASIQLYDSKAEILTLVANKNFHPRSEQFWEIVSAASGSVCGEALRRKLRVIVTDVEKMDFVQEELEIFRVSAIRSVQSTPLVATSGNMIGMISTHWNKVHRPTEAELKSFDAFALQIADLIEQKTAQHKERLV